MMLHCLKILHWFSMGFLGAKIKVPNVTQYTLLDHSCLFSLPMIHPAWMFHATIASLEC